MDPVKRYKEYEQAFEVFFESNDPSVLEQFFTETAVHHTIAGPPLGNRVEGRDAILAAFVASVDGLDRRFDSRHIEDQRYKEVDGASVAVLQFRLCLAGVPNIEMEVEERAEFEGNRISLLEDRMSDETSAAVAQWMAEHGHKLA